MHKLDFGEALKLLKIGKKVSRSGWNGKGMWLELFSQSNFITVDIEESELDSLDNTNIENFSYSSHIGEVGTRIEHIGIKDTGDGFYPIYDFILMKTADNKCVPWLASQTDILAEDWSSTN